MRPVHPPEPHQVFLQAKFRQQADAQFVLVLVDFPKEAENRNQVENHARNRQVAEHFGVAGFPTIVLADMAKGRPYGVQGYVHGGVSAFLQQVRRHQAARQRRDRAMTSVQSAAGATKLAAIRGCLDVLEENDLLPFYSDALKDWTQMALPGADASGPQYTGPTVERSVRPAGSKSMTSLPPAWS